MTVERLFVAIIMDESGGENELYVEAPLNTNASGRNKTLNELYEI